MTCPTECRKEHERTNDAIHDLKKTLFGPEGRGGVVGCLGKYISKKGVAGWVCGLLAVIAIFVVYGMESNAQQKKTIAQNSTHLSVHDAENEGIRKTVDEIKRKQDAVMKTQTRLETNQAIIMSNQLTADEMRQLIKEAMKP